MLFYLGLAAWVNGRTWDRLAADRHTQAQIRERFSNDNQAEQGTKTAISLQENSGFAVLKQEF